jgi:hypothetical protein
MSRLKPRPKANEGRPPERSERQKSQRDAGATKTEGAANRQAEDKHERKGWPAQQDKANSRSLVGQKAASLGMTNFRGKGRGDTLCVAPTALGLFGGIFPSPYGLG